MLFGYAPVDDSDPAVREPDGGGAARGPGGLGHRGEGARKRVCANGQKARSRVADLRAGREVADEDVPRGRPAQLVRVPRPRPRPVDRVIELAGEGLELVDGSFGRHRAARARSRGRRGARLQAADVPEPAGRDELHRPCLRRVVDLDLVVHARVGDVDALGISLVEDGETAAREPGGHGAVGGSLFLDRGVRTWERVGNDGEVRLVGADVDAVRQIAHVDVAVAGLRQLVGEAAPRAEPEDRMLDLGGEVSELGPRGRGRAGDLCRVARRAAVAAQQEPGHETGRDRDRDHRSEPELRSPDNRGKVHPTALTCPEDTIARARAGDGSNTSTWYGTPG